jgi:hypothetical protein
MSRGWITASSSGRVSYLLHAWNKEVGSKPRGPESRPCQAKPWDSLSLKWPTSCSGEWEVGLPTWGTIKLPRAYASGEGMSKAATWAVTLCPHLLGSLLDDVFELQM